MGYPLGQDKPSTQFAGHTQFPRTPTPKFRSDRGIHPQHRDEDLQFAGDERRHWPHHGRLPFCRRCIRLRGSMCLLTCLHQAKRITKRPAHPHAVANVWHNVHTLAAGIVPAEHEMQYWRAGAAPVVFFCGNGAIAIPQDTQACIGFPSGIIR